MLPNFLCIGAQKSGTTTLLEQLSKHPDIFMSPAREARFFLHDHLYSQGMNAYEMDFFSAWDGEKMAGEKTPEYLCDPLIASRIHQSLGTGLKFIAALRSPAQRAYAQYRQNFQYLRETVSFHEALRLEPERSGLGRYQRLRFGYLWRSRYPEQLDRYLALFPRSGFFFCIYEHDIVTRQEQTLVSLFRFLGVDPGFKPDKQVSAGRAQTLVPRIFDKAGRVELEGLVSDVKAGDILLTRAGIKPRLVRSPSDSLLATSKAALRHIPLDTALTREMELEINTQHFKDDIHKLEEMIGRDMGFWLD